MALAAVVLLTGCLGARDYTAKTNYILRPEVTVEKAESTHKTVGVRPFDPAESVRDEIAYRDQGYELHYYDSSRWAESPRDVVTRSVKDALSDTGRFGDVGDSRDVQPEYLLTGEVREFEEVRSPEGRFAVVTVRMEFRNTADNKAVWTGTLTSRIPVEGDGLSALAASMSRAVAEITQEAVAGIVKST